MSGEGCAEIIRTNAQLTGELHPYLYAIPLALATLSTTAAAKYSGFDPFLCNFLCNFQTVQPAFLPCDASLNFPGPTLVEAKNTTCFSYRQPNSDLT